MEGHAVSAMGVRCVSHVGITVTHLEQSVSFYEAFGFRVAFRADQPTWSRVGMTLDGDGMLLELFSPYHPPAIGRSLDVLYPVEYGRPKLALTVADIEAAYEKVVAMGFLTLGPIEATAVSRLFFVLDPDRTPIQVHWFRDGQARVSELFVGVDDGHPIDGNLAPRSEAT